MGARFQVRVSRKTFTHRPPEYTVHLIDTWEDTETAFECEDGWKAVLMSQALTSAIDKHTIETVNPEIDHTYLGRPE